MFSSNQLSEDQISSIKTWAEDGDSLADIQRRLNDEFGIKVTYLETRFLLEDLKIELKSEPVPEPEEDAEPEGEILLDDTEASAGPEGDEALVTVDQVQRPGALVSGKVTFAGGKSASWYLDQMGRLGMDPESEEFEPNEAQMMSFQKELQAAIQKSGL